MAERTLKNLNNGFTQVDTTVKDGEKNVPLSYQIPTDWSAFQAWVAKLPAATVKDGEPEGTIVDVYNRYVYAHDLKERAKVRENVAAETVEISRDGKTINLHTGEVTNKDGAKGKTFTVTQLVGYINAATLQASLDGKPANAAFQNAAKRLIADGKARQGTGDAAAMLVEIRAAAK